MISNDKSDLRYMQEKLRMLEDGYKTAKADTTCDPHVQEIELRSLKQLINQLKEEICASRFMLEPSDRGLHTKNSRMVPGGILIHDMNRGIGRTRLFLKKGDFHAIQRTPVTQFKRVFANHLLSNHWLMLCCRAAKQKKRD